MDNPLQKKDTQNQQLEGSKNSRILNRKQIQKRLQALKPAQHEKVISNLTAQNKRLKQQVRDLHEKVQQLIINKKIANPHHKNPMMQQQVKNAKKQLASRYEVMNNLKEELKKVKFTDMTEEMKHKIVDHRNQMYSIDVEMEKLQKEKLEHQKTFQSYSQAIEQYNPKTEDFDIKMNKYREENKILRTKVEQFQKQNKTAEEKSKQVINKFYDLKNQQKKFMNSLIEAKMIRKNLLVDPKSININEVNSLQKQVQSLRKQKKQAQKQLVIQKIAKDQKKSQIQQSARQNLQTHKQLMKKKMKALNELNLYQAKDRKQKQVIQTKQTQINAIETAQRSCQTDKIVPIDFRKQWIGSSLGIPFDDSATLDYRSHMYIRSLIVYKVADYICFVKFTYENNQKKRYDSKVPFDQTSLRKMQSKKYVAKNNAYLKTFSVSLTNQIITLVQFTWSDRQVVVQGWQNQASTKFIADINPQQRPISMFGSVANISKNAYALESLGCQVSKSSADQ